MGQFLPADHSRGDANTIGGYMAVHNRPAAFEGRDGASYSVEIVADQTSDPKGHYAAYLLFVRWRQGDPVAAGHLETDYLGYGDTEPEAIAKVGAMHLNEVRSALDFLIAERTESNVPWWEAMREEGAE